MIALAGTYGTAAVNLSESGANRFLNDLEHLSLSAQGKEYCARLHDDLKVSTQDHSADPPADFEGGRDEFCNYVSEAAKGMDLLGAGTHVTRDDFTVTRSWLHLWTAHVSYNEDRITTMSRVNVTLHSGARRCVLKPRRRGGLRGGASHGGRA
ncbi:MAG: hypothetical protein P0120_08210 [Nitrospira sp.]|nr:hypothetical protein [Nitrospira sp.]